MKFKIALILSIITLSLLGATSIGQACQFYFNYQEIQAPLGVIGTIAIRVLKDHQQCSMDGMEYQIGGRHIQILEETEWAEVDRNLYEKRLQVLLSEIGEGYLLISKDCDDEGYGERRLSITIGEGGEIWEQAFFGEYPYETEESILSLKGSFTLEGNHIIIDGTEVLLSQTPENLDSSAEIILYYRADEENQAVLIIGEEFFYQF